MTMAMSDWAAGEPCELHDIGFCTDCRDAAKIRRDKDGQVAYQSDCAVQTFIELTGAGYDEAFGYLAAAGFVPGKGTPAGTGLQDALRAVGYEVREVTGRVELGYLPAGSYFVSGFKGSKGHAWSVIDGKASRAYHGTFRYRIFEVTA